MRKLLLASACLSTVLTVLGGAGGWWHYTSRPEYLLRKGQAALGRGNLDVVAMLAARLEASRHADHAHLLLGELYLRQNRPAHALQEFNKIGDQGALRLEAVAYSGQCLLQLKNAFEAARCFEFVLAEQPDHVACHRGLAVIYYDQGAIDDALEHLRAVARLDPGDGRPYRLMGLIYKDLGRPAEAVSSYQEALKRPLADDRRREVREELTESLLRQGDYTRALEVLDGCDAWHAERPKILALRSECLLIQAKIPETKELLDHALRLHPGAVELQKPRAKLHLLDGEAQQAAALLEQILEAQRHDVACRYQLIQAYRMLDRTEDAAAQRARLDESQALVLDLSKLSAEAEANPWDAGLRLRLADVCEKLDKTDLAATWRRSAAACPKVNP
ncbi:MAG: tetratricopeptide repeat protein [Gemmataceae bacterium]|nr:tetratricopeptide repeat protein [Gemmataceae bacterium]